MKDREGCGARVSAIPSDVQFLTNGIEYAAHLLKFGFAKNSADGIKGRVALVRRLGSVALRFQSFKIMGHRGNLLDVQICNLDKPLGRL